MPVRKTMATASTPTHCQRGPKRQGKGVASPRPRLPHSGTDRQRAGRIFPAPRPRTPYAASGNFVAPRISTDALLAAF